MIYLDNAATTQMYKKSAEVMYNTAVNMFANASSQHSFGLKAETITEKAREEIAQKMGVSANELYFTPCGTLADTTAILGSLKSVRTGRIITTSFEHPAVLQCFKSLEDRFDVVYIKPDNTGHITAQSVIKYLTPETKLVSIMHVNNETGAISPLKEISYAIKKSGCKALFHTDAVQGFMKEDFDFSIVDMASFSAHKTHGPKGLGALFIKTGVKVSPIYMGGGQEHGLFSGTTNTPSIAAWAESLKNSDLKKEHTHVQELNRLMRKGLTDIGAQIISPDDATPYIINAVFEEYMASNILNWLSQKEIYISQGSACSSKHGSHVFQALGLEKYQKNAIRISFCSQNTCDEVNEFIYELNNALHSLLKKN